MGTYSNHLIMMSVEQAMVMIYRLFGSTKATDADILDRYQDGNKVSPPGSGMPLHLPFLTS